MGIYECNEEYVRKTLYEDGYESGKAAGYEDGKVAGYEDGKVAGYEDGKAAGYEDGKTAERNKMILVTVNSAMRNFNLSLEEACKGLGVEIEAYDHAKAALEADCQKENS
ncbi:MAG: hypothetical protein PUD93_09640 [Lachnospiraceae bacterium]|nr:hypothetical protein [Lachnospiraceae bacterium]